MHFGCRRLGRFLDPHGHPRRLLVHLNSEASAAVRTAEGCQRFTTQQRPSRSLGVHQRRSESSQCKTGLGYTRNANTDEVSCLRNVCPLTAATPPLHVLPTQLIPACRCRHSNTDMPSNTTHLSGPSRSASDTKSTSFRNSLVA